jgi:hypothetical protein
MCRRDAGAQSMRIHGSDVERLPGVVLASATSASHLGHLAARANSQDSSEAVVLHKELEP